VQIFLLNWQRKIGFHHPSSTTIRNEHESSTRIGKINSFSPIFSRLQTSQGRGGKLSISSIKKRKRRSSYLGENLERSCLDPWSFDWEDEDEGNENLKKKWETREQREKWLSQERGKCGKNWFGKSLSFYREGWSFLGKFHLFQNNFMSNRTRFLMKFF